LKQTFEELYSYWRLPPELSILKVNSLLEEKSCKRIERIKRTNLLKYPLHPLNPFNNFFGCGSFAL